MPPYVSHGYVFAPLLVEDMLICAYHCLGLRIRLSLVGLMRLLP